MSSGARRNNRCLGLAATGMPPPASASRQASIQMVFFSGAQDTGDGFCFSLQFIVLNLTGDI
jgi:hypothetical protein